MRGLPATVAIKSAEDAKLWGVHLATVQRDAMDALVDRLAVLWRAEGVNPDDPLAAADPVAVFEHFLATDAEVRRLAEPLHFRHAAKRRGFFLHYLGDALQRETIRLAAALSSGRVA